MSKPVIWKPVKGNRKGNGIYEWNEINKIIANEFGLLEIIEGWNYRINKGK